MLSSGTRIAVFMLVLLLAGTAMYWVFLADPGPDPFDVLDEDVAFLDADPDDMPDRLEAAPKPIDDRIVLGDSARERSADTPLDGDLDSAPELGDALIDDDDLRRLRDEVTFEGKERDRIVHPWDTMRRVASGGPIRVGGDGAGSSRHQPPIGDDARDPDAGKGTTGFEIADQPANRGRAAEQPPARSPAADEPARRTEPALSDPSNALWGAHVVQHGDTVVAIAESWFGEPGQWDLVLRANPGVDPTRLAIGQRLRLPPRNWRPPTSPENPGQTPRPTPGTDGTTHEVRPSETLSFIARTHYGRPELWRVIYEANRETIGADPGRLKVGTRLRIPPAPTAD